MFKNNLLTTEQDGKLQSFFDEDLLNTIAKEKSFIKREPKKITPLFFILGFIKCCGKAKFTLNQWATQIGWLNNLAVSKQALSDRINENTVNFTEATLKHFLQNKLSDDCKCNATASVFSSFGKVLLQDSTTLALPDSLAEDFPGNTSNGVRKALARIQTIINIKTMQLFQCTLTSYSANDQSASKDIVQYLSKGDLVIRDLGYFVLDALKEIIEKEAHFVSRLRYGVTLHTLEGVRIDIAALIKSKKKIIDMAVLVGKCKIPVRLVMVMLPETVATEKVRKAKCDRNMNTNHSEAYYDWCRYNSYITTVPETTWAAIQIAEVYKVRWQIEILFKSWKSAMNMQEMLKGVDNVNRVKVCIYMMLLFITLFMVKMYMPYKDKIEKIAGSDISILKFTLFVWKHVEEVIMANEKHILQLISKHCLYEKRHKRRNMTEIINEF